MTLLAIDLGTACGWALMSGGLRLDSGTLRLAGPKGEHPGRRFRRARRDLGALLDRADAVAYEQVRRHAGTQAAHVYGGLLAVLAMECDRRGLPLHGVEVAAVKQRATGKGNAQKAAMVAAARERWGVPHCDDNEADALWIGLECTAQLGG